VKWLAVILLLSVSTFGGDSPEKKYSLELQIKDSSPGNMTFTDGASDYKVSCQKMPSVVHFLFPGGGFYGLHEANRKDRCLDYPLGTQFRARIVDNKLEGVASASSGSRDFSYKLISTTNKSVAANQIKSVASAALLGATFANSSEGGAEITGFLPNSPIQAAGLHVGDVIKAVDLKPVESAEEFRQTIAAREPGANVHICYVFLHSNQWWVQKEVNVSLPK
jgi:membrane-associated protease RseP (regulator of RpoE activity)